MKFEDSNATAISTTVGAIIIIVIIIIVGIGVYAATRPSSTTTTTSLTNTTSTTFPLISSSSTTTTTTTTTSTTISPTSTTSTSSTTNSSTTATSSSTTATGTGTGQQVIIPQGAASGKNFDPSSITITAGTTVTFVDQDSQAPHNVWFMSIPSGATNPNSAAGQSSQYEILQGQSVSYTLTTPGTYTYECQFHSWMQGTIIVTS